MVRRLPLAVAILFGLFFTLMFLRVPVAFALGLACLPIYILEDRLDPQGLKPVVFAGEIGVDLGVAGNAAPVLAKHVVREEILGMAFGTRPH